MATIKPSENPVFNAEMEAVDRTTPAHYSEWNKGWNGVRRSRGGLKWQEITLQNRFC